MRTDSKASLQPGEPIVTKETIRGMVLATAHGAMGVFPLRGCTNRDAANDAAVGALASGIIQHVSIPCVSKYSEGRKDRHTRLAEGKLLTKLGLKGPHAGAITDPLECEGRFVVSLPVDRASTVLFALGPVDAISKVDSARRVKYLVGPPGSPVGPGLIESDSAPDAIVQMLCKAFDRDPMSIVVTILNRPWNDSLVKKFRATGAEVNLIQAGDWQAMIEAGSAVTPEGPVKIAAGLGGLVEAFLAVPYLKWSGGHMLMQVVPDGDEMAADDLRGVVYTEGSMIQSYDTMLAAAGLTHVDGRPRAGSAWGCVVPGIRHWEKTGSRTETTWVSVFVASPVLERCENWVVEFKGGGAPTPRRLEEDEALEEHIIWSFIEQGGLNCNLRLREERDGDRLYFLHWYGSPVPTLETMSEREFDKHLEALVRRGRVRVVVGNPSNFDTCDYDVEEIRAVRE